MNWVNSFDRITNAICVFQVLSSFTFARLPFEAGLLGREYIKLPSASRRPRHSLDLQIQPNNRRRIIVLALCPQAAFLSSSLKDNI